MNDSKAIPASMQGAIENCKNKIGKIRLTEDEILLLSAEEIIKSFTHEEKDYKLI